MNKISRLETFCKDWHHLDLQLKKITRLSYEHYRDELIKEYQEMYGKHDPRAPKWAKELMEKLIKNG